jgi:hypothetical protein
MTHRSSIIDQFTRQAVPFSQMPGHTNEPSLRLLMEMLDVNSEDTVLDVACALAIYIKSCYRN